MSLSTLEAIKGAMSCLKDAELCLYDAVSCDVYKEIEELKNMYYRLSEKLVKEVEENEQ